MLPPVLEIYIVWHCEDPEGEAAAKDVIAHFHGASYSGLIGGAVEVYFRTAGWLSRSGAPRPIPLPGSPPPNGVAQARFTVVVPVLGIGMAKAVENNTGGWREYIAHLMHVNKSESETVRVFPLQLDSAATRDTRLGDLIGPIQCIAAANPDVVSEPPAQLVSRDLAQFIAQWVSMPNSQRLTVFISHTKHATTAEGPRVAGLISLVRTVIADTRLNGFFDAQDLAPGGDFDAQLRASAGTGALIAIRTDVYASREWCQLEMIAAKEAGLPIVMLDALETQEERGSFLMDHIPRIAVRHEGDGWRKSDVYRALGLLVDEALKRALWKRQSELARGEPELDVSWWAPHAPEPITLVQWLWLEKKNGNDARLFIDRPIRILHPDPPLSPHECEKLSLMASLFGFSQGLDIMTPRLLAARGG